MRIGVIIPDRGDRPEFLENCLRMIKAQTLQPVLIELVNDKPLNEKCDITWRYRTGYNRLRNKDLELIALMENDDWYSPIYLETMVREWKNHGTPDLFGTNYTIYYHLKLKAWLKTLHNSRASAMNTLIRPDLNFKWCPDHEAYTDLWLWTNLKGKLFCPKEPIAMGMKHGTGMCGGRNHIDRLHMYTNMDTNAKFLAKTLDADSYEFYFPFSNKLT